MRSPTQTITDLFDVEIRCVAALQMNLNDPFYIYVSTTARLRRVYFSLYTMYKMNKFCHFNGDFKGFCLKYSRLRRADVDTYIGRI